MKQNKSKSKHSSKKNSNNLNLSNNNSKDIIDSKSQSQSINISDEKEEDNLVFKRSCTYKLGEGITSFKINNFNDNTSNELKKSRTYKEENGNGLKFPYRIRNNQIYFGVVLETINEVSSRLDSSELSDDDENNDDNKNKNNNDNDNYNGKIKGGTNNNNNKRRYL